ncbi:hypothetical protein MMMDOFMJ_0707 [Methylobacterium gnaphalii]|uniref:Uncharacterized protein n=2 Tax=Methylobacterium gnaphalii TaxID=1010610 RepID=A0A512JIB7_9HYPH|nr:hypothetical protein [Methylobacterium gnaphalii]GEP09622.1 hypothetical protein MGN01_14670 [Methylobacterium gnaphalii]GJD67790.1 hypothetical protein MMMDOFMJ_0707 [Methylobacterium gnaphalii]GLS48585.1 hypothetical protein GCM10007885_14290 [Methylobacterium gnaphalii]
MAAVVGLATIVPALAQPYGGRDYGYDRRDYDRDYRDRGYNDRDYRGRERNRGDYAFDEREYLRCNPDVRRAIVNGQVTSGLAHYRTFGRRENRRLSC